MKWILFLVILFIAISIPNLTHNKVQGTNLTEDPVHSLSGTSIAATHLTKPINSSFKHHFMIRGTTRGQHVRTVTVRYIKAVPGKHHFIIVSSKHNQDGQGIPVITYHHLLTEKEKDSTILFRNNNEVVSVEQFASEMQYLHKNGFKTCTLEEVDQFLNGKIKLPKKSIMITFDDGYLSNYHYAYPILKKYHFRAILFAVGDFINKKPDTFNPQKLNFISWPEIPAHSDVFEIASHTIALHHLDIHHRSFLVVKPQKQVLSDLITARNLFHSGYFAYPYDQYNNSIIKLLQEAGYHLAFTDNPGMNFRDTPKFELHRFPITPAVSLSAFKKIA